LIAALEKALGRGNAPDAAGWDYAASVGLLWEDAIAGALAERYRAVNRSLIRPGELSYDGIYFTPDALDPAEGIVWEFKATWRSARLRPPELVWRWVRQVEAYCHALGYGTARIVALYLCGSYAPPSPLVLCRSLSWSQEELGQNWAMLKSAIPLLEGGQSDG